MSDNNIMKQYSNGAITVAWNPEKCTHAGKCLRGLPEVFGTGKKEWINLEDADSQAVINQVKHCPSGALSIMENEK